MLGWLAPLVLAQVLTRPPTLVENAAPTYPPARVAEGHTATVLLELEVSAEGRVVDAIVVESGGADFDAAALEAARRLVFRAAQVDGVAAAVRLQYRSRFELAAAPPVIAAPRLWGRVRDRWSKAPVVGARVTVTAPGASIPDDHRRTTTGTSSATRLSSDPRPAPAAVDERADHPGRTRASTATASVSSPARPRRSATGAAASIEHQVPGAVADDDGPAKHADGPTAGPSAAHVPAPSTGAPDPTHVTLTSTAGTFAFAGLRPGPVTLELTAPGYPPLRATETLIAGEETRLELILEPLTEAVDDEEIVRAPRPTRAAAQIALDAQEARRIPGTQGDTVKVVQTLPGVARPPLGSGAISVWGAAPEETKVLLDGVEIPSLYHLGGVRSLVPSELVERVALTPAGQGAAFGRGVGGIVEVDTRTLDTDALHAAAQLDVLDAGAWVTARPGADTRMAVAARQSVLHALIPALTRDDVGALFPLPNYRDLTLMVGRALGFDEHLDVLALGAQDRLARTTAGIEGEEASERDFAMIRGRWRRGDRDASAEVVPSVSWTRSARTITSGGVTAATGAREVRLGLRAEHRQRLVLPFAPGSVLDGRGTGASAATRGDAHPDETAPPTPAADRIDADARGTSASAILVLGLDGLLATTALDRAGSLTIPAREGDPAIFGRSPGDALNADAWSSTLVDVAPYAAAELTLGSVTVTPGLRVDFFGLGVSRRTPKLGLTPAVGSARLEPRLAPRLAAAWTPIPAALSVRSAVGLYAQPPEADATSAVFGNPLLGLADSAHAMVAIEARPLDHLQLELAGFAREARGLTARSTEPTPRLAEALTDRGEGRAAGAQALARIEPPQHGDGPSGWVSYTVLRSERRASETSPWRRADFDRTHALSVVAGYALGPWSFGSRLRWTSGAPATAVVGRYVDARRDLAVPVLGPTNGATLPDFFQLDLRAERRFALDPLSVELSLELQNVTAHANVEALAYAADYQETREVTGLPFLAVLGLRVEL